MIFPASLWPYLKERFPVVNMLLFAILFLTVYATASWFQQISLFRSNVIFIAAGIVTTISFFFRLRVFDEIKDYAIDQIDQPQRVLQSGRITLPQLQHVAAVLFVVEATWTIAAGKTCGLLWVLAIAYSLLMRYEFFCVSFLKKWLILYAFTHKLIMKLWNFPAAKLVVRSSVIDEDDLSGGQQIASAKLSVAIQLLATQVVRDPGLNRLVLLLPRNIHQQVDATYPLFFTSVVEYIELYGDRTIGELKLETITMRLDPFVLYKYLRNIVIAANATHPERPGSLRADAEKQLNNLLAAKSRALKKNVYKALNVCKKGFNTATLCGWKEHVCLARTAIFS